MGSSLSKPVSEFNMGNIEIAHGPVIKKKIFVQSKGTYNEVLYNLHFRNWEITKLGDNEEINLFIDIDDTLNPLPNIISLITDQEETIYVLTKKNKFIHTKVEKLCEGDKPIDQLNVIFQKFNPIPKKISLSFKEGNEYNSVEYGRKRGVSSLQKLCVQSVKDKIFQYNYIIYKIIKVKNLYNKEEWNILSNDPNITVEFIRFFKDEVNWKFISANQKLSESFIREFKDRVIWEAISQRQELSESFIKEFGDRVDWNGIYMKHMSSKSFSQDSKREFHLYFY